ncbi:MAG: hypothetical protein WDN44_10610 [Sphingomonas sp.]
MVVHAPGERMNLPLAPLAAALLGVAAAAGVALMPVPLLEGLVNDSGVASVVAAAEPPLGLTARAAIALACGGLVAVFGWFTLFILLGTRGLSVGDGKPALADGPAPRPVIRRADAHPDANPRAPLLATRDLGEPFQRPTLDVEVDQLDPKPPLFRAPRPAPPAEPALPVAERELPADLGQPLSAFDPAAIPDRPRPVPIRSRRCAAARRCSTTASGSRSSS